MALPILDTATYELTLPSSDVKVKFRPFLVKEEKILLMAMESEDTKEITKALKEIVHACTFGSINVTALPTFDLEYIFLHVRAKSVGEVAKLRLLCPDDKKTYANVEVDLSKVEVQVDDKHSNEIKVNDKVKIIMKYPTIDMFDDILAMDERHRGLMFIYAPYPGTPLYENAVKLGFDPPKTLEGWGKFNLYDKHTPWITRRQEQLVPMISSYIFM